MTTIERGPRRDIVPNGDVRAAIAGDPCRRPSRKRAYSGTRTARDEIRYEVTVDDPGTFEQPYTAVLDLKPQGSIFEYACHEGNRGLANILSAERTEEKR